MKSLSWRTELESLKFSFLITARSCSQNECPFNREIIPSKFWLIRTQSLASRRHFRAEGESLRLEIIIVNIFDQDVQSFHNFLSFQSHFYRSNDLIRLDLTKGVSLREMISIIGEVSMARTAFLWRIWRRPLLRRRLERYNVSVLYRSNISDFTGKIFIFTTFATSLWSKI